MNKRIFKIPVGNISRRKTEKSIAELMSDYTKDVWIPVDVISEQKRKERIKKLDRILNG